jgi:uncharacterized protein with HEPN domain
MLSMRRDRERILDILETLDSLGQSLNGCEEKVIGLRNVLVHEYFGVDRPMVWEVAIAEAPLLRAQVAAILKVEFPE